PTADILQLQSPYPALQPDPAAVVAGVGSGNTTTGNSLSLPSLETEDWLSTFLSIHLSSFSIL
ncbi:MAG: hypothetical protein QXZ70_07565, partial [Candidatus Bathyarchaeia archaeon]